VAGIAEATALAAFYQGLTAGAMGVVAPISAVAGVVPLAVGLAGGDPLTAMHLAGAALALGGVVMTSVHDEPEEADRAARRRIGTAAGVGLALTAALFFGLFFVSVDRAAQHGGVLWAVLVTRATLVALVVLAFAIVRPGLPGSRRQLAGLAVVGLFDIGGTTLYALATMKGLLSVVGVIASAYPIITILLARFVLDERLGPIQRVGSVTTLTGVVLLSA
jgi:drug/metabolite transporter (DMT)-like permease